jgi:hypothetical protein
MDPLAERLRHEGDGAEKLEAGCEFLIFVTGLMFRLAYRFGRIHGCTDHQASYVLSSPARRPSRNCPDAAVLTAGALACGLVSAGVIYSAIICRSI